MQRYSFQVRCSPCVWLLSGILAACGSFDLEDSPQPIGDSGAAIAITSVDDGAAGATATNDGGSIVPSSVADGSTDSDGGSAAAAVPQSTDASSPLPDAAVGATGNASSCEVRCGNGRIDPDEDCEIGLPGWTPDNCSASCRQTLYPNTNPCTFEVSDPSVFYSQGNCPDLPGFTEGCFYLFGLGCQLVCNNAEDCPIGFTCKPTQNHAALGPGWCAKQ